MSNSNLKTPQPAAGHTPGKATAEDVAKLFGVPIGNIQRQYAKNAKYLREAQKKAGTGKYRGFSADWYRTAAEHAENQAKAGGAR